jgi:NADH-quinone oxidoreductase subunit N
MTLDFIKETLKDVICELPVLPETSSNFKLDFIQKFSNEVICFLPEIFLVMSILTLLIYGVVLASSANYNYPQINKNLSWLSVLVLFITLLLLTNNPFSFSYIFNESFIHDDLGLYAKYAILTSSILCILMSQQYCIRQKFNSFEYYIIMLLSIMGMILLVSAYDLISAYLAIELQSLSFYILAAFKRNSSYSTEAGLKYFVLGAFSSGLILFGMSILYGTTGMIKLKDLKLFLSEYVEDDVERCAILGYVVEFRNSFPRFFYDLMEFDGEFFECQELMLFSLVFIASGILFKLAAAPFHMWSPDVYEGSPSSSTAFFAIVPKIAVFVLFIRLFHDAFCEFHTDWTYIIAFSSVCSVIIGSFVAIKQRKMKRLIAYSSISHVGYLLIAFAYCTSTSHQALFFYLMIYMITGICLWSILFSLNIAGKRPIRELTDLEGLHETNPILAISLALVLFSLAGVPPLAGFFAKMQIFLISMQSSMFFLAIIGILSSVISTFYYIRIIKIMYFEKTKTEEAYEDISEITSLITGISLFLLIFLFVNPTLLNLISYKMTSYIFF